MNSAPEADRRLAVLGSPIDHSLSPALHSAAYEVLGLDWAYGRHRIETGELEGFLDRLDRSWLGLSLTMPLKREALRLADEADDAALVAGAANTLVFSEGRRRAYNTDVYGVQRAVAPALEGLERVPAGERGLVLFGAGATASSALIAVHGLGVTRCELVLRDPAKAEPVRELAARLGVEIAVHVLEEIVMDTAPVLRNGLVLAVNTIPAAQGFPVTFPAEVRASLPLFEVSYDPWPTAAAAQWGAAGGTVISGLEMLLHQALVQVRIFHGGDPSTPLPDEDRVLAAMRAAGPEL